MEIARTWRQQASNLRLVGCSCGSCQALIFPKRIRCPECGSAKLASYQFSGSGRLVSVVTVREAPRGFGEQVPYLAGLVRLDEGPVVAAMITDVLDQTLPSPGAPLAMVTRRIRTAGDNGPIVYGYKFRPVRSK